MMKIDTLTRSIAVQQRRHMFFFGAGASITSGVLSAEDCIWRWKHLLFISAHPHLNPVTFGSPSLPHVQDRIQSWLERRRAHPERGAPGEYSHYVEAAFPRPEARRAEFQRLLAGTRPHIGYRIFGMLMEAGKVRWVWTTNFDDLVEKGRVPERKRPFLQVGMDTRNRVIDLAPDGEEAVQVFLHGDYRYDPLRNTADELGAVDDELRAKLAELIQSYPLVVTGYSGRDESVMSTLRKAYSRKAQDLYWCVLNGGHVPPEVQELLSIARSAGSFSTLVTYDGFDDLMVRLGRVWLPDPDSQSAIESVLAGQNTAGRFELPDGVAPDSNWILGNALEVELPRTVFEVRDAVIPKEGAWRWLREKTAGTGVSAGLFKGAILAIGERLSIADTLGVPSARVREITIRDDDLTTNSALQATLLSGFVDGIRGSFERVGRYEIASPRVLTVEYDRVRYQYRQSLRLSLERAAGRSYLTLEPNVFIVNQLDDDTRKAVKREILAIRYSQWVKPPPPPRARPSHRMV